MLKVPLQKIVIVLLIHQALSEAKDLLHLFRPKPDLPQELNDFLTEVQHHKKDFAFIRNVAKHKRKYEKSFRESHRMLADDINNQLKPNSDYNPRENEYETAMQQYDNNRISSEFDRPNSFKSHYPELRYSKFIHSPVRLRRQMEENYLNQRVQINPNGDFGNIKRFESKYPSNRLRNDENRYRTGYLVGIDDDDDDDNEEEDDSDYYPDLKQFGKKKREVEISIKSNGKLVKHIEEDAKGPESIILNIQAESTNTNNMVSTPCSTAIAEAVTISTKGIIQEPIDTNSGPSNSKTIPSLSANQNKNIGVPINSIPTGNLKETPTSIHNDKLQEMSKVFNTGDFKSKLNQNYERPYYKPEQGYGDFRWSGENNHNMAKSIDMAQNNINNFDNVGEKNPGLDFNNNKQEEFEKVQGLVMDSTIASDYNSVKDNYIKRQSMKKKRFDERKEIAYNVLNGFDYSEPLAQEAQDLNLPQPNHHHPPPESSHWDMEDSKIHLNTNQTYRVIEQSTRNILIIPVVETTEYVLDIHVPKLPQKGDTEQEREKAAEQIGEAIAEQIEEKQAETTTECEVVNDSGENHDKHKNEQVLEDMHNQNKKMYKRANKKQKKKVKTKKGKDNKKRRNKSKVKHHKHKAAAHFKRDQIHVDRDSYRNKKHLLAIPKHKRKQIRQHPKKRISRNVYYPSLSEYYDVNELYNVPEEEFDFIPSFRQRQLKSIEYEFDPGLVGDVGDQEKKELEKLKKTSSEASKIKGARKKMKSEGDYADEEDSVSSSPRKKVPIKRTQNEFALDKESTPEENDDDYDYADLTNMEDEDEDIAYEEEIAKDNTLEVEEAVGNNNKNEHENDRFDLNGARLKHEPTSRESMTPTVAVQIYSLANIDDILLEANKVLASAHGHGHGASKKKKKKKHPKRETKSQRKRRRNPKHNNIDNILSPNRDFPSKPLTNQQKQDLFLRYNPEFQRLPRFVQKDDQYNEMIKQQQFLDNRRRYSNNQFPISNEYFLNPKVEFVKREEPSESSDAPETSSEAASSEAASTSEGASSEAASSEAASSETAASSESDTSGESAAASGEQSESSSVSTASDTSGASNEATTGGSETSASADQSQSSLEGETSVNLSQAADNMLKTANSDLFPSSTAGGELEGNNSALPSQFQFSTNAGDLTPNSQCGNTALDTGKPCLVEGASHSPVTITSVLPLIPESATAIKVNITKDEFLDLNEIVGGALPRHVVAESLSSARGSVRQGLRTNKFNTNLMLTQYNSSMETNLILSEMTNLMMRLRYHSTCQALTPNLLSYVKIITKNEMDDPMMKLKEMDEIDFDEHQSNYVFRAGQGDSMQEKAEVLKELLNKYNSLPANCKERAEPVKEYILSHLAMIDHVTGKGNSNTTMSDTTGGSSSVKPKAKKEINSSDSDDGKEQNLDDQMMEEGLQNQNADANEVIENHKNKRQVFDEARLRLLEVSTSTSPQYGKLAQAVRNVKNKREVMKRISEIYGKVKRESEPHMKNYEQGFESPRIIRF